MLMPKAPLFFRLFGWTPIGAGEIIVLTFVQVAATPFWDGEGSRREQRGVFGLRRARSEARIASCALRGVPGGVTRAVTLQAARASQDAGQVQ